MFNNKSGGHSLTARTGENATRDGEPPKGKWESSP
jgi:hypothetical protein